MTRSQPPAWDDVVCATSLETSSPVCDEIALLGFDGGIYRDPGSTPARVWRLVRRPIRVSDIPRRIAEETGLDPSAVRREFLEATRLERTLVDIAVRPVYAGGVHKVLAAYSAARERASVNVLMATLKKLGHLYPYHQTIGFYLERAGYDERALDLARRPGLEFDFYVAHGMKDREFSREWRVWYPRSL